MIDALPPFFVAYGAAAPFVVLCLRQMRRSQAEMDRAQSEVDHIEQRIALAERQAVELKRAAVHAGGGVLYADDRIDALCLVRPMTMARTCTDAASASDAEWFSPRPNDPGKSHAVRDVPRLHAVFARMPEPVWRWWLHRQLHRA